MSYINFINRINFINDNIKKKTCSFYKSKKIIEHIVNINFIINNNLVVVILRQFVIFIIIIDRYNNNNFLRVLFI